MRNISFIKLPWLISVMVLKCGLAAAQTTVFAGLFSELRRNKTIRIVEGRDYMMGYRRVSWVCGLAASIAFCVMVVLAQSPESQTIRTLGGEKLGHPACRATGDVCFLGIAPDIYRMPLPGEYVQTSGGLICATRNWSSFPPEAFGIDFLRKSTDDIFVVQGEPS